MEIQKGNAQMQDAIARQLQVADLAPQALRGPVIQAFVKRGLLSPEEAQIHMSLPDQLKDTRNSLVEDLGELAGIKFDAARELLTKPKSEDDKTVEKARFLVTGGSTDPLIKAMASTPTGREQAFKDLQELLDARDAKAKAVLPSGAGKPLTSDHKAEIEAFKKAAGGDPAKARKLAEDKGWIVQ